MNIKRSKKINDARLRKMKERDVCLMEIKTEMRQKLKEERTNNHDKYIDTVKNLILQSMIKMLEPKLKILCREEDKDDIRGFVDELQSKYHDFLLEQTGRDEYNCELEILDESLSEDQDKGCGGVILYTDNNRIVCPNTLLNRLDLAFEEFLPQIRKTLFPGK